jgi:hypothetical protein
MGNDNKVQGEGDYEAARRYRERTDEFVENNDIEKAALRAAPRTPQEAAELKAAETAGKKRWGRSLRSVSGWGPGSPPRKSPFCNPAYRCGAGPRAACGALDRPPPTSERA